MLPCLDKERFLTRTDAERSRDQFQHVYFCSQCVRYHVITRADLNAREQKIKHEAAVLRARGWNAVSANHYAEEIINRMERNPDKSTK